MAVENGFIQELDRFGPQRSYAPMSRSEAQAYCSRLARSHYENFTVASYFLPRRLLRHFYNVYAYCRWADDLADETGGGSKSLDLLRWWREELLECYSGRPHHPVMVALQGTIQRFNIPREPFIKLLYAFEQDQLIKRYQTFAQLLDYCKNSANPVGHLVLYLCESYSSDRAKLSDHICTGLQLANFWQDVDRDLDIGRVYLPEEDRLRFGYTEEDLQNRRYNQNFQDLMAYLVDRARDLFWRGYPLVDLMPRHLQTDIELFIKGGEGILQKIEQMKFNVWKRRPVLSKWEKLSLMGRVFMKRIRTSFW